MKKYSVRIVMNEIEIEANTQEEAEKKAINILHTDAKARVQHCMFVDWCETEEIK